MKRLFSLVFAALLMLPLVGQASATESPQSACVAGGDGSAGSPYVLCTEADLELLRTHPAAHFVLGADIQMTGNWDAVTSFSGLLDGHDHAITGLNSTLALFGTIESTGEIRNLNLTGINIKNWFVPGFSQPDTMISPSPAGIASINYGLIDNCFVSGTISGLGSASHIVNRNYGTIQNSRASGNNNKISDLAGGIVAINYNGALISNSVSEVNVSGRSDVGGVAAINGGTIQDSWSRGEVVGKNLNIGGLVGHNESTGIILRSNEINGVVVETNSRNFGVVYGLNHGQVTESAGYGNISVVNYSSISKVENVQVAAKTYNSVTLNWDPGGGVLSYDVLLNGEVIGVSSSRSYTATGLDASTPYSFTIVAKSNYGKVSQPSTPLSVTTDSSSPPLAETMAPSIPDNVGIGGISSNSVTLNWSESTDNVGVTGYEVLQDGVIVGSTVSSRKILITELTPNTTYNFQVRARDAAGNLSDGSPSLPITTYTESGIPGGSSVVDTTAPTIPGNFAIAAKTENSVWVTWSRSTDEIGVVGYDILQDGVIVGTTESMNFTITGLSPGTAYTFQVKAKDRAGNVSAASIPLSVTTYSTPGEGTPVFVKGINFVGYNVTIEGNNWLKGKLSSITTSRLGEYGSNINLQPTADFETTTMLSSGYSVIDWDNWASVNQHLPNGIYEIYLWAIEIEQANSTSFHVKLEGEQVTSSPIGEMPLNEWRKYGPYTATLKDGLLNMEIVKLSGSPIVTGMAIYSENTTAISPIDNIAPSIPENFNVQSKSHFSVSLNWNLSTDNVRVTSYDVFQDGVPIGRSDVKFLLVNGLTPRTTYNFTIRARDAAGNVSEESAPLSVTTGRAPGEEIEVFFKGINFNGNAVTVEGNAWLAESSAGVTTSTVQRYAGNINLLPTADSETQTMLNSAIFFNKSFNVTQPIANGNYAVYLWTTENYRESFRYFDVYMEGEKVGYSIGSMSLNSWRKHGPYNVTVQDGIMNMELVKGAGDPTISGMAIYSLLPNPPADTVAPSAPGNVAVSSKTYNSVSLSWSGSTDNVGVTGYDVLQDGVVVGTTPTTDYTVTGLNANTAYNFAIVAKDNSGNASNPSAPLWVTTHPGFYYGINFNGGAVTVDGQAWHAEEDTAVEVSNVNRYSGNNALLPETDSERLVMLNSAIYSNDSLSVSQTVSPGTYDVYLWTTENYQANSRSFNVKMEGSQVTSSPIGSMPLNEWRMYGPYTVQVNDYHLDVELVKVTGDPTLSGIAIYSPHNAADIEAPTIPQNVSVTSATYNSATLTWSGSVDNVAVLGYDVFQDGSLVGSVGTNLYTVNGLTPNTTYSFTVKAKDQSGNISDASTPLPVTTQAMPGGGTPIFIKGINFNGSATIVEGNSWLAESAAGTSNPTVHRYVGNYFLQPAADNDTNTMLNRGIYSANSFSVTQPLANGNYEIYLWSIENYLANSRSFHVKLEDVQMTNSPIGSMPLNEWRKYGPYTVTVQDGVLDMELVKVSGDPTISGMTIYSNN